MSKQTHTFVAKGTERQPKRIIISTADTLDAAKESGEWISAGGVMEVKQ